MITGTVNARLEVLVRLSVRDAAGYEQEVEALLDTGFTGELALPAALIGSLGLAWLSRGTAVLANGSVESFDVYDGVIDWDGSSRQVAVEAIGGAPLIGMALLEGHVVRVQVQVGGSAEIEAIP